MAARALAANCERVRRQTLLRPTRQPVRRSATVGRVLLAAGIAGVAIVGLVA
jgi:hypothetical protein